MIKVYNNSNEVVDFEKLYNITKKINFYIKPFNDRKNEELRQKYLITEKAVKEYLVKMKEMDSEILKLSNQKKRLDLIYEILDILSFITRHDFLTAQNKKEIKLLLSKLKLLPLDKLNEQLIYLRSRKRKILNDRRV